MIKTMTKGILPISTVRRRVLKYCFLAPVVLAALASGALRQRVEKIPKSGATEWWRELPWVSTHLADRYASRPRRWVDAAPPRLKPTFFQQADWPNRLRKLVDKDFAEGAICIVDGWVTAAHELAFLLALREERSTHAG